MNLGSDNNQLDEMKLIATRQIGPPLISKTVLRRYFCSSSFVNLDSVRSLSWIYIYIFSPGTSAAMSLRVSRSCFRGETNSREQSIRHIPSNLVYIKMQLHIAACLSTDSRQSGTIMVSSIAKAITHSIGLWE
jgi:hypothetical protein